MIDMKLLGLRLAVLAVAMSVTGPAPSSQAPREPEHLLEGPGEIVPLRDILAAVRRIVAGKVIDIELETSVDSDDSSAVQRWVYEIEVLTDDDQLVELEFDARTGQLLEVEGAPWPAGISRPVQ